MSTADDDLERDDDPIGEDEQSAESIADRIKRLEDEQMAARKKAAMQAPKHHPRRWRTR